MKMNTDVCKCMFMTISSNRRPYVLNECLYKTYQALNKKYKYV